jgi:hypothetical protein
MRLDLIAESDHAGAFDVELQLPAGAVTDELMQKSAAFGNLHVMSKVVAAAQVVPFVGDYRFRLKKDAAADFTALQEDDIRHIYLVIQFAIQ